MNIWAADVPQTGIAGSWQVVSDPTAAGGRALFLPDKAKATISPALAAPVNYVEVTFDAAAGVPYHLWIRMRAYNNGLANDSVTVQFGDSVDALGTPVYRIGTTHGAEVVLQDGPSGTLSGWGWANNGFGRMGPDIYFASSGTHTLRLQQREDGPLIDQIVLSPDAFLRAMPGTSRNDMVQMPSTISGATPAATQIDPPWQSGTVGIVGVNGVARFEPSTGVYSIHAGGGDIWGSADGMHFVYRPLTGDGSIVARVTGVGTRTRAPAPA